MKFYALFLLAVASFAGANGTSTPGPDFQGQTIADDLSGVNFTNANFSNATIVLDSASSYTIDGATFDKANLENAVFHPYRPQDKNNLIGHVSFHEANLRGADLSQISAHAWSLSDFKGAVYDQTTQFPPYFDPSKVGMNQWKPHRTMISDKDMEKLCENRGPAPHSFIQEVLDQPIFLGVFQKLPRPADTSVGSR